MAPDQSFSFASSSGSWDFDTDSKQAPCPVVQTLYFLNSRRRFSFMDASGINTLDAAYRSAH